MVEIFQNIKKHIMMGVSYLIPCVAVGGLLLGLGVLLGGGNGVPAEGTFASFLFSMGSQGLSLMAPIIAAYVGFSIADKAAIAPGLICGLIANASGAGFIGGIVAGIVIGIIIHYLKMLKLPKSFQALQSIIFIPLISTLVTGCLVQYVVGGAINTFVTWFTGFVASLDMTSVVLWAAISGAVSTADFGLFLSKATAGVLLTMLDRVDPTTGLPSVAAMTLLAAHFAACTTPPIVCGIATLIAKKQNKFTEEEMTAGKTAFVLGAAGVTEGAIPFAISDYVKVAACSMLGSAIAAGAVAAFGCTTLVMWGGLATCLGMPNIGSVLLYILSIAIGGLIGGFLLAKIKKPLQVGSNEPVDTQEMQMHEENGEVTLF